jgi:hypothetical protein
MGCSRGTRVYNRDLAELFGLGGVGESCHHASSLPERLLNHYCTFASTTPGPQMVRIAYHSSLGQGQNVHPRYLQSIIDNHYFHRLSRGT